MVRYVLLRPLRPEIDGQVPFQTFQTLAKQCEGESIEREKGKVVGRVHLERVLKSVLMKIIERLNF
jgi:hypothetical protein